MQIPACVPIHHTLAQDVLKIRDETVQESDLIETKKKLFEAALKFLDEIVQTPSRPGDDEDTGRLAPLMKLIKSIDRVSEAEDESRMFKRSFNEVRETVWNRMKNEPELTMENVGMYAQRDPENTLFSRILEKRLEEDSKVLERNKTSVTHKDHLYLKNAAFIIDHPLDPLPDENADDDLQVEGGKVDIKCPLSLRIFEQPMRSKKCGHTFDYSAIKDTWRHNVEPCPVLGCGSRISINDFEPDELMNLRVKSFHRLQRKLENDDNVEKI